MKINKKIISILAISGVIAFTGVQANDRHSDENKLERLAQHLDLTADQQSNISAIMAEFKGQHSRPNREEMKVKVQEMKARFASLMAQPSLDEAQVIAELEQRSMKKNEMMLNKIKLQHAIYQQLTPEQQPLFLESIEKVMRKKMWNMKERMRS